MERFNIENKISINDYESVYKILRSSLPDIEMRNYESQKKLLEEECYCLSVYRQDNDIKAFIASWEFEDFSFIEHFAVDACLRGKGIGGLMLKEYLDKHNKKVILEVELPENKTAIKRIEFYKRYGFNVNTYKYEQPPMQEKFKELPLLIMSFPDKLNVKEFENVKKILFEMVYKTDSVK